MDSPARITDVEAVPIAVAPATTLPAELGPTERSWPKEIMMNEPTSARPPIPTFQVDPTWPTLPSVWGLGLVSGVAVAPDDHIWVIHRPRTVKPEQLAKPAPPVLEFDADGNFIQGWGGDGDGYEWPGVEHGITVDPNGFVWIGGSGTGSATELGDDAILKFTTAGNAIFLQSTAPFYLILLSPRLLG